APAPLPPPFPYTPLFRSRFAPHLQHIAAAAPAVERGICRRLRARLPQQSQSFVHLPPQRQVAALHLGVVVELPGALPLRRGEGRSEEHTSELQSPYELVC